MHVVGALLMRNENLTSSALLQKGFVLPVARGRCLLCYVVLGGCYTGFVCCFTTKTFGVIDSHGLCVCVWLRHENMVCMAH